MIVLQKAWENPELCEKYLSGIEISTDDVHYGYLSPGERELNLLGHISGARVLEVCCGAAQNCIALAKQGAICTGVDISSSMLKKAEGLAHENGVELELILGDAAELNRILSPEKRRGYYDIVVSSYGICFVKKIKQLFKKISISLKQRGIFVFCVTHPCQVSQGTEKLFFEEEEGPDWRENFLAINQALLYLHDAGFLVERIVEQTTKNPSRMSREEMAKYPYRLTNASPDFDKFTHKPHTIIYACKKL